MTKRVTHPVTHDIARLNRLLAMYADEAERVEYTLAGLWYTATSGVTDMRAVREAK